MAQPAPDGQSIAVYRSDTWVIYPTACLLGGQACQPVVLDPQIADVRVAWGPDGSIIAYMTDPSNLRLRSRGCWDARPGTTCLVLNIPLSDRLVFRLPHWSADGQRMAFLVTVPPSIYVLDTACFDQPSTCKEALKIVPIPGVTPTWPTLSTDSSALLYTDLPKQDYAQIWLLNVMTAENRALTAGREDNAFPAWSPDGRYVVFTRFEDRPAYAGFAIYLFDLERGIAVRAVRKPSQTAPIPVWGPAQ
jgi:Tol biopolymer transport system component